MKCLVKGAQPRRVAAKRSSHGALIAVACSALALACLGVEALGFVSPLHKQIAVPHRGMYTRAEATLVQTGGIAAHTRRASPTSAWLGAGALLLGMTLASSRSTSTRSSTARGACLAMQSNMRAEVDALIAKHPVFIISKEFCPFCRKAKAALDDVGVKYEVLELESSPGTPLVDDPAAVQDYMLEKTGARSVPRVFINGHFVGGGDDIIAKRASGELATLLQSAGVAASPAEVAPFALDDATVQASEKAVAATGMAVGGPLPNLVVQRGDEFPPSDFNLTEFCQGKKVPGYLVRQDELRAKSVTDVLVFCVNDAAVMKAWGADQGVTEDSIVTFLADPHGEIVKALNVPLDADGPMSLFAQHRSKRFSMLIENGIIKTFNIASTPDDPAGDDNPAITLVEKMLMDI